MDVQHNPVWVLHATCTKRSAARTWARHAGEVSQAYGVVRRSVALSAPGGRTSISGRGRTVTPLVPHLQRCRWARARQGLFYCQHMAHGMAR